MIRSPKHPRRKLRSFYRPHIEALEDRLPPATFAVIGNYGAGSTSAEPNVAALVQSWNPDFVITVGNNNSPTGAAASIDANVGQYYHGFIYPYTGKYGPGAASNRFWPSLGNQDWGDAYPSPSGAQPYLSYFTLPNNGRYYTISQGPVQLFALDSDPNEPDGNTSTSIQAQWLQNQLAASTATWKIVYFNHAPYSSGSHYGSNAWMQWPFQAWGATAVISGHDQDYERLVEDNNFPYFVVGTGGARLDSFGTPIAGSQARYDAEWGALKVTATSTQLNFQFSTRTNQVIDSYTLYTASESYMPAAPSNLMAAAVSTTQVDLAWTDNSSNEDAFQIERSTHRYTGFTPIAMVSSDVTTYTDTGLTPGIQYFYELAAINAAGASAFSNVATDITAAPAAPTNLTAVAVSPSVINLSWTENSGNARGFKIERSTDGVIFAQVGTVGAGVASYTDIGLAISTPLVYRVRASNGVGDSSYSPSASASTAAHAELITDPNLIFPLPVVSKPSYLVTVTDPIFGAQITRVAGDPAQSLTTQNDGTGEWSAIARHEYSNIEPWNATGSLMMIENRTSAGGSPGILFLDGSTYQVEYGSPNKLPLGSYEYRWHPSLAHANELIVFGGTTLEWFNVVTNSVTRSWTLPFATTSSGKQNATRDGRFIALFNGTRMFVVDMDPQAPYSAYPSQRIGPVFDLATQGLPYTVNYVSISPSGKYVLVHYANGDYQQVFDVSPDTLGLTPRPMANFYPGTAGTAAQGFIYNLGHPDMTLDPFDNNEDVIIGQEENGNVRLNVPGVQTVNSGGIGHVIKVRLRDGLAISLTDPGNGSTVPLEAWADHISTQNFDRPGWAYVSYWPQDGRRFSDEIVAVKLDGSGTVERLGQAHSNFIGVYRAEAHAVPSPDGKRLLFASNWELNGNGLLNSIQDYVLDTRQASTLSGSGFPSSTVAGVSQSFVVTLRDVRGDIATVYRGTVHFKSSDPQAVLPADYAYTAADNGSHTFSVSLATVGMHWLTVSDAQNSSLTATQAGISVTPAAAKTLVVTGFPAQVTAGTAGPFMVTARDAYGNTATGYNGTVHFTSSDPQAVLPADYAFTAADNGVQTFMATLETAEKQWLASSDTMTSSITGMESSIQVQAAAASTLMAAGFPSPAVAGVAYGFTVTAEDPYGNKANSYRGTIHFSSSDPQAILRSDYAFTAADNGRHTFSPSLATAGTQSLTVTDTQNSSLTGTQAGISVTPAAAKSLVEAGFPVQVTAGTAGPFIVTARDAYGNIATGYNGTVHFTSSDPQAVLPADYAFTAADNGVHTFTATLETAGKQWLTGADTVTRSISGSETGIFVQAAAASTLVAAGFPSPAVAGVLYGYTVTAEDPYGNKANSYRGTIRFSSSDPQAVLRGDYTFTAADNGRHGFSGILKTAGSQTVTVTDITTATITGRTSVVVVAAAATHFSVNAPAHVTAAAAFSVVLTALDAYGNVATGYTGTVQFSSSDSLGILPGNYIFTAGPGLDNGVHTFTVTLSTAGSQWLTASDTAASSITGTQTGIVVAAASGDSMWQQQPADPEDADGVLDLMQTWRAAEELVTALVGPGADPGYRSNSAQSVEAAREALATLLVSDARFRLRLAGEAPGSSECIFPVVAALGMTAAAWSPKPAASYSGRKSTSARRPPTPSRAAGSRIEPCANR